MVGVEFLEQISKLQVASYVGVEDFADKFNFLITVLVIMLCTTTVTVKQYMMKPISCYMSTDIGGRNLLDYVENYCWVEGTIPIKYSDIVPSDEATWNKLNSSKLLYYQWVPFVLGLQCILFYLPRLIWQMICYNRSGTDVQHLVTSASQAVHSNEEQRTKLVKHLAKTLEQMLFQQHRKNWFLEEKARQHEVGACGQVLNFSPCSLQHLNPTNEGSIKNRLKCCFNSKLVRFKLRFMIGSHQGVLITFTYFLIKLLYLTNSTAQLFLMHKFINTNPLEIISQTLSGHDWHSSLLFPRVGFCVVPIRHMAGSNYATAQCVLPVNMLNEKIYLFLWMWITLVTAINIFSTIRCIVRFFWVEPDAQKLLKWLRISEIYNENQKKLFNEFSKEFLRHDGMFIARLLQNNAGEIMANEIISTLWLNYVERDSNTMIDTKINRRISTVTSSDKINLLDSEIKTPTAPHFEDEIELPIYKTGFENKTFNNLNPGHMIPTEYKGDMSREINEKERRIDRARHWFYKYVSVLTVHKRLGNRLWGTYLLIKFLYLSNSIGQLFLMRDFLGFNSSDSLFGVTVARNILQGKDWETTKVFPRVGYCPVRIQHMPGSNTVTAQCVLPVNMLNERIYVFLWFWIFLSAIITAFSIPIWFARMTYMKTRTCYIKKFLKLGEEYSKDDKLMVDKFCRQFLRHDGIFLLRMISLNSGELITSEIVCQLWKIFKRTYAHRKFLFDKDDPQELKLDQDKNTGKASTTQPNSLLNGLVKNQVKDSENNITSPVFRPSAPPKENSNCPPLYRDVI